jgi:uncharacterized protein DUF6221
MSGDPVAFLRARYDEIEAAAKAAADGDSGQWFVGRKWNVYDAEDKARFDEDYQGEENRLVVYGNEVATSEHIALNDPAYVLADIASRRRILEIYERVNSRRHENAEDEARAWLMDEVVAALMAPFASHPEYQDEWRNPQ